uniref:tRNA-uridine aminocarboxypropyltransferase n=1 Tax=Vitis vinifera TaxID=29760 RepID=F6HEP2_VITVI
MATQTNSKRPICPSCSKPARTCLCSRIPIRGLENKVGVTILQHSLERKHPLNSTRIATLGLKNLTVASVSDVNFEAQFEIRLLELGLGRNGLESLDFDQGSGYRETLKLGFENVNGVNSVEKRPQVIDTSVGWSLEMDHKGVLNVSHENKLLKLDCNPIETVAREKEDCVITATIGKYGLISSLTHIWMSQTHLQKPNFDHILASPVALDDLAKGFVVKNVLLFPSEKSVAVEEIDFEVKNLIVLDGTWAKAKRMYNENPWLKLLPHLKLEVEKMSLYSEVRHQPKAGYLSTIESIVYSLKAVGDNPEGLDGLLDVFESMVGDQRQCKDERLSKASLL